MLLKYVCFHSQWILYSFVFISIQAEINLLYRLFTLLIKGRSGLKFENKCWCKITFDIYDVLFPFHDSITLKSKHVSTAIIIHQASSLCNVPATVIYLLWYIIYATLTRNWRPHKPPLSHLHIKTAELKMDPLPELPFALLPLCDFLIQG